MKWIYSIRIAFITISILNLSCEDDLPTREVVPIQLFETIFQTADSGTTFTATRDPINIHTEHPPPIVYQLQLINIFDETLQGVADSINGTFEIWLENEPTVGKTFLISQMSEFPPDGISSQIDSSILTLDPGDTFYVEIEWPHETDDSVKMWDYFNLGNGDELDTLFNALAKIQLFPGTPHIVTGIFVIRVFYLKLS